MAASVPGDDHKEMPCRPLIRPQRVIYALSMHASKKVLHMQCFFTAFCRATPQMTRRFGTASRI